MKVLLDFTGVEEISSETLQLLFSETKRFKEINGVLGLSNFNDALMAKVRNAGLEQLLLIFRDEQEALKAMV